MKQLKYLFVVVVAALMGACASAPVPALQCYYQVADITPTDSVVLAGFAARKGLSDGVYRPLKSHCLVLRNATEQVCIITNDMMEISTEQSDLIRGEIAQRSGLDVNHIFLHCTHTHSAPRTGGWTVEPGAPNVGFRAQFIHTVVSNAVEAITAERSRFVPFRLEIAKGSCLMNYNRCEKEGPCDRDVYALRLVDTKDKPIVALLNYSCHPVSLGWRSKVVAPDFTAAACTQLQQAWGCPVFYFTGASGNIDPAGGLKADTAYTAGKGKMVADAIAQSPFTKLPASDELKVVNREIDLPYQVDSITPEAIRAHVKSLGELGGVSDTWNDDYHRWEKSTLKKLAEGKVKNYLPFQVGAVNVGGAILFFTQGEPFCEYQMQLRQENPDREILFIAYTNGQNSYLPSAYAYASDNPGYNYEKKEMHVYIGAPFPLSERMPAVYSAGIAETVNEVK
jgi:hypothetical protein